MTPISQYRRHFYTKAPDGSPLDYEVQATARMVDDQIPLDIYTDMIVKTTKLWLYLATQIQNGVKDLPEQIAFKSVEQSITETIALDETMQGFMFAPVPEARVTVFDWNHVLHLTLHSDDAPQYALGMYWAMHDAQLELAKTYPTPQTAVNAPNPGSNAPQGTNTPPAPANPSDGVIVATLGPSLKKPQYAHGQLVSYTVTQIDASSEHGSPTFKLTITVGKYPITIFKLDSKGQPKKEFELVAPVLNGLGLDFNKPSAKGTWRLVCKANHVDKDGTTLEYMNVVSLTPI